MKLREKIRILEKRNQKLQQENIALKMGIDLNELKCSQYQTMIQKIDNIIFSNTYGRTKGEIEKIKEILKESKI